MKSFSPFIHRLFRSVVGIVFAFAVASASYAQSSVEKSETTQQTKQQEDELALARAAVAKPGQKQDKPEIGRILGRYSVQSSMEVGYRFENTKGNRDSFLSQINVRDGFRLLEYSLDSRALDGNGIGLLYDSLRSDVNNAGGDQSQTFSLRMDKKRAYRFDANMRRFNYFRTPGQGFANGWRDHDLRQQISDYHLKLFPQRAVRLNFGYGRSMATGRFTSPFSFERDLFPILGSTRWGAHDYRAGIEATWHKWSFNSETLYRRFKNDSEYFNRPGVEPGFNPTDNARLSLLDRDIPLRARSIVTRGSLQGSINDRVHIVVRGLHDDELMTAPYYELAGGNGATTNVRILSRNFTANGVTSRPSNTLDAGVTFDLNQHFALSNTFRYTSFRIQGDMSTEQITRSQTGTANPTTATTRTVGTNRLIDLTSYWNTLELNLNFSKKFTANLGWRAMNREVTLGGIYATPTSAPSATNPRVTNDEESINTNAFVGGMRWRPTNRLSFIVDTETGTANNAFVRINPLEYTRFRFRTQIQATDKLSFTGAFTSVDRRNPTRQVENESDTRSYTAAVNWEPNARVWLNVGYDYHDLFTTANLLYSLGNQTITGRLLAYGRMNSAFTNARVALTNRLDLLLVYYYLNDRGAPSGIGGTNNTVLALPLRRHNPEARFAYRFNNHFTGNVSYRHFSYNERDLSTLDYRSNITTISARFNF